MLSGSEKDAAKDEGGESENQKLLPSTGLEAFEIEKVKEELFESKAIGERSWEESKKMWEIALPAILTSVAQFFIGFFTIAFVGHLGQVELAAVAVVQNVIEGFLYGIMIRAEPVNGESCLGLDNNIQGGASFADQCQNKNGIVERYNFEDAGFMNVKLVSSQSIEIAEAQRINPDLQKSGSIDSDGVESGGCMSLEECGIKVQTNDSQDVSPHKENSDTVHDMQMQVSDTIQDMQMQDDVDDAERCG